MRVAGITLESRPWRLAPTRRGFCLCCLGLLAGGPGTPAAAELPRISAPRDLPSPVADHHLHIQGPEMCAALQRLKARDPSIFQGVDPSFLNQRSGGDALRLLDAAGIERGVLLSEAYMFGSPLMAPDHPDVARLTRAENAYNVDEARRSGGRLVAFIGVDPLSDTALPEIDHWSGHGAVGVKLHLANSFFDFNAPEQIDKLAGVFAAAGRRRLPIVIHLRNRLEWGAAQADAFIDKVLPAAAGAAVQVAHGAGWGALDTPTVAALEAFSRAIAAKKPGADSLTFDLAVVAAPWTKPEDPAAFVRVMREIGMVRFCFGSDWPAKYTPEAEATFLKTTLPLTSDEWRLIFTRRAPFLSGRLPA